MCISRVLLCMHNLHGSHRFGSASCCTAGRLTPTRACSCYSANAPPAWLHPPLALAGFVARLPQLYGDLPPALRHKLAAQQLRPVLRGLHFFPASMRSKEAAACCHVLAAFAHPLSLSPGQSLDGESAEGGGGSTGGGGNGGGSSSGGSTGGSGGGNGAGGSGGCTVDRPPAASKAMYILCTGERFLGRVLCMLFVESLLSCPGAAGAALVDLRPCPGPPQGAW